MKIITIIGARPQFIKAAMVSKAIMTHNTRCAEHGLPQIEEKILHTGQHYDYNMSQIFFDELGIPAPTWHLGCSASVQEMQTAIREAIKDEKPDYILVYGDTNSTLAGALVAEERGIRLIHVEAGLRSYNAQMAEEYNRIETDKRSCLLFCPTHTAVENLRTEGITQGVHHVGDVMYDAALFFANQADRDLSLLRELQVESKAYYLSTIHRAETTNDRNKLKNILEALRQIDTPIILPMHPRTRKVIEADAELQQIVQQAKSLQVIDSVSYTHMVLLERHAQLILTDSGGVQKEAYFHGTPCITMRDETEWVETVEAGWNILVGSNTQAIIDATRHNFSKKEITEYGDGHCSEKIITILCQHHES